MLIMLQASGLCTAPRILEYKGWPVLIAWRARHAGNPQAILQRDPLGWSEMPCLHCSARATPQTLTSTSTLSSGARALLLTTVHIAPAVCLHTKWLGAAYELLHHAGSLQL